MIDIVKENKAALARMQALADKYLKDYNIVPRWLEEKIATLSAMLR